MIAVPDQWKDRHAERIAIMTVEGVDLETATAEADREIADLVKFVEKEKFMKTLRDLDAKYAGQRAQWKKT